MDVEREITETLL